MPDPAKVIDFAANRAGASRKPVRENTRGKVQHPTTTAYVRPFILQAPANDRGG
jgi:hypothetical protein